MSKQVHILLLFLESPGAGWGRASKAQQIHQSQMQCTSQKNIHLIDADETSSMCQALWLLAENLTPTLQEFYGLLSSGLQKPYPIHSNSLLICLSIESKSYSSHIIKK